MQRVVMRTNALAYFAFALGWSILFWSASVRWGTGRDPADSPLFLVGGAGPFIAALALTHFRETPDTRRDFWIRVFDVRRIRGAWWAAALLLHPLILAAAMAADVATGGAPPSTGQAFGSPLAIPGLLVFVFWFGPLPEEIGWRGFALDRLQRRTSALGASLVLGSVWALWHVPLFFVPGTFQAELGPGSTRFWVFMATLPPLSVLMTWVYNNTDRSTLSAVLIHYSGNLCGVLLIKSDRLAALEAAGLVVAAVFVTLVAGPKRLVRGGR